MYGLSLTLFDSLLFPLLLADFAVFWVFWQLNVQLIDPAGNWPVLSRC